MPLIDQELWDAAVAAWHEQLDGIPMAPGPREGYSDTTDTLVILRDSTSTLAVYEIATETIRQPQRGERQDWERRDDPWQAALDAWVAYCEEHTLVYQQPSQSGSDVSDEQVVLCNGYGALAIYNVEEDAIKQPSDVALEAWERLAEKRGRLVVESLDVTIKDSTVLLKLPGRRPAVYDLIEQTFG